MASIASKALRFFLVIFIALLIVIWFVPAPLIKWGIEKFGTQAVGAKVDVERVDFSWLSSSLSIEGLAVTNPKEPMTNMVAFKTIATRVKVPELISGHIHLSEMLIEGIALDAARETSGAVPGLDGSSLFGEADGGFAIPGVELPDMQSLVDQERAVYENKINEFQEAVDSKQQEWEQLKANLPQKEKIEAYKQRFKALKKNKDPLSRIAALRDLEQMSKEIKADIKSFDRAKDQIQNEYQQLQKDLAALKSLPDQSLSDIVRTLGLEDSKLASLGASLIEGPMRGWIDKGFNYYKLMSGGTSDTQATQDAGPKTKPALLIDLTNITGPFTRGKQSGHIDGTVLNFSDAPALAGKPIVINLKAEGGGLGTIGIEGVIDHLTEGAERDQLLLKMADTLLQDFLLSDSDALNVILKKAQLNLDASLSVASLQTLDLDFNSIFKSLELEASGEGEASETQTAILKAVQGLSELLVDGSATGELSDPKLQLKSNLDDVLKSALGDVVNEKAKAFKSELKTKLTQQINEKLAPLDVKMKDALGIKGQIADQQLLFENLRKHI